MFCFISWPVFISTFPMFVCLSEEEILKLFRSKCRRRYGKLKTSPTCPPFCYQLTLANGAGSGRTAAHNLCQEQAYCGNLVINSVTQYILPSYRLSRPRPRDFTCVIYSFIAGLELFPLFLTSFILAFVSTCCLVQVSPSYLFMASVNHQHC